MNVVSQDSKTLGHRMGAFQSALQILQNIVAELQRQGALGAVTCKQLSVILNQVNRFDCLPHCLFTVHVAASGAGC
jgi:hypothetical protein